LFKHALTKQQYSGEDLGGFWNRRETANCYATPMFGVPSLMGIFTEDREKLKNTFGII